jgi:hypothetical protein
MTGAPPTTSDCNKPLTGAPGIGSTDLLSGSWANGLLFLRSAALLSILFCGCRFRGGLGAAAKPPQLLSGQIHATSTST